MSAPLPYKYTTSFREEILAASKIESGEWKTSKASLGPLEPLIPKHIDFEKNIDLLGVAFNAAVVNRFNRNDDGIDTLAALAIKDYFVNKPTNLEHQKKKVVGHIVSSAFSKFGTNEILENEEVSNTLAPFNIACAAVLYRTVHRNFTDLIQNPDEEFEKKISASWEIGFNQYAIAVGSKDLAEAEIIAEGARLKELSQYLRANEGPGELEDGTPVYRLVVGDIYPLGIGFTTNPAADVEGVYVKGEDDNMDVRITKAKEIIEVNNLKVYLKNKNKKEKTSHKRKRTVNSIESTNNSTIMENEILTKLERVLSEQDFAKEFSQEAVADIGKVVQDAIRQKSDEYVAEKEKASQAEQRLEDAEANFKSSFTEVEEKLQMAEEKISALETEKSERESKERFNERMGVIDNTYDLSDKDRQVLAKDVSSLEAGDESFTEFQEKAAIMWQHKDKQFIKEQEDAVQTRVEEEVQKRLSQTAAASKESSEDVEASVDEVLENAEAEAEEIPNTTEGSSQEEVTLRDQFAKAFNKDNLTINY